MPEGIPQADFHFDPERYPTTAGCFIIKDDNGRALLVGGTVNLRRRLSALFERGAQPPARIRGHIDDRIQRLVAMACDIEVFLLPGNRYCPNLANSLIERCQPLFNLATYMEPSGSSFVYQTTETFPRFTTWYKESSPPADCFGPFPSATRDLLMKSVSEGFGIRTCKVMPRRACVSYQLKLCSAPCEGRISKEAYTWQITQAARLLSAPGPGLIDALETQRQSAADALDFERAGRIHAQVQALKPAIDRLAEERGQQYETDHDVEILYIAQGQAMRVVFQGGAPRLLELVETQGCAVDFLRQRFSQNAPPEIILGGDALPDLQALSAELTRANGYPVAVHLPAVGPALELLEIARANHAYRVSGLSGPARVR
jgi:excinuclease ABC subunit C